MDGKGPVVEVRGDEVLVGHVVLVHCMILVEEELVHNEVLVGHMLEEVELVHNEVLVLEMVHKGVLEVSVGQMVLVRNEVFLEQVHNEQVLVGNKLEEGAELDRN